MIKDKFLKLIDAYKDDKDLLEFIDDSISKFPKYVDSVVTMEYRIPILRLRLEGQKYRDAVMNLDENRRMIHNTAMDACKQLNRISEMADLEPFFTGNPDSRQEVADFACEITNEFFASGTNKEQNIHDYITGNAKIDKNKSLDDIIEECSSDKASVSAVNENKHER